MDKAVEEFERDDCNLESSTVGKNWLKAQYSKN